MIYRPEIDGLRAIAVVTVMLFHAGISRVAGGFVGVDVFFVISGYLITTHIMAELDSGDFNLLRFYERRARRLLPALFTVMLISMPFAFAFMLPDALENFGQSVVATTLFSNNILLLLTAGYWDISSELKPLLHTWSLGVEEQFYFVYPWLLIIAARFSSKYVAPVIFLFGMLSFYLSERLLLDNSSASFYLLPTRAWELLSGALVAMHLRNVKVRESDFLASLGLMLIIFPVFYFDYSTVFPGANAGLPVLGTVLVLLYASGNSLVASQLGSKFLVGIGLISYSAYLFHQPMLSFAKIWSKSQPPVSLNLLIVFSSIIVAYLSWRYVEKPFRNPAKISTRKFLAWLIIAAFALLSFGLSTHLSSGWVIRVAEGPDVKFALSTVYNERNRRYNKPHVDLISSRERILVVGNSHGRDFVNFIREGYSLNDDQIYYRNNLYLCLKSEEKLDFSYLSKFSLVVFASNYDQTDAGCILNAIEEIERRGVKSFFAAEKEFGDYLNWIMRVPRSQRGGLKVPVSEKMLLAEEEVRDLVGNQRFIPLLSPLITRNELLVTDAAGRPLSQDGIHTTKYGAQYIAQFALSRSKIHCELLRLESGRSSGIVMTWSDSQGVPVACDLVIDGGRG